MSRSEPLDTVWHLALAADWARAQRSGSYEISTRGRSLADEGFIHASFSHQLDGVAARFYADVTGLLALEIDTTLLDADVVVEPGDANDPASEGFPHIYGSVPVAAIVSVRPYPG